MSEEKQPIPGGDGTEYVTRAEMEDLVKVIAREVASSVGEQLAKIWEAIGVLSNDVMPIRRIGDDR